MAFTRLVLALARGEAFELNCDSGQSRGFTYVADVADVVDGTIGAMERGDGLYNIGGATEATVNEVITLLESISGRKLKVVRRPAAKGDVRRTNADTTRLRNDTGWEPNVTLSEGLAAQWRWALEAHTVHSVS